MRYSEFDETIKVIFSYFGKKWPARNQVELWFEKVKAIPEEALIRITQHITDQDRLPSNIGNAFHAGCEIWRKEKPENPILVSKLCNYCDGTGLLYGVKKQNNYPYQYVFRCGHCENWQGKLGGFAPRATISELIQNGYEVNANTVTNRRGSFRHR